MDWNNDSFLITVFIQSKYFVWNLYVKIWVKLQVEVNQFFQFYVDL